MRGRALGCEAPRAASSRCLLTHPVHPNYTLLGFRVSTPQPPYQGELSPPDTPRPRSGQLSPGTPGHPRTPRIRDLDRLLPRRDDSRGAKQGRAQQGEADRAASMPTPSRLSPERSASKYGRARDEFGSEVFSVETRKRAPVFHTLRSKIPVSSKSRSQS